MKVKQNGQQRKKAAPRKNQAKKATENEPEQKPKIFSSDLLTKKPGWKSRRRILTFATRGISHRGRHLMKDIQNLLPHAKTDSKMEKKDTLYVVNEICESNNCSHCIFFEANRHMDTYLWLSKAGDGPSAKFMIENVHTMDELKFTGNCLRGSRALLSFDDSFDLPHFAVVKELLVQTFGTPNLHPRSQPFVDHVFSFTVLDGRIWFRNFQLATGDESGALVEIGPRFTLLPIKVFEGSFCGRTLWANPNFVAPAQLRRAARNKNAHKYTQRVERRKAKESANREKNDIFLKMAPVEEVFADESESE